jgi:hypothetical protein
MSYRRSDQQRAGSDRWRHAHRGDLLRWLPAEVVDSERSLNYVLLHAEDHAGTGWTPEWLPPENARAFLRFLENAFSERAGYEIFRALARRSEATR